ncbi:Ionotropic receptor 142 [Frankliniella occidentalis]|nr:Ionotropic receptor 142 [Frankliniella occidentalis]
MHAMAAILAVALLCAGLPSRALSAVPVVDVSPAPEAASAVALLAAFLGPHKAGVVVVSRVRWTDDFVRNLPRETPRVVLTSIARLTDMDSLLVRLKLSHNILMVVGNEPDELTAMLSRALPKIQRVLFWASGRRPAAEVLRNTTFVHHISRITSCVQQSGLVISAVDGTAISYVSKCTAKRAFLEVDRWSPAEHRWLRGAAVFTQFCDQWQPPPSPADPFTLLSVARQQNSYLLNVGDFIDQHGKKPRKIKRVNFLLPNQTSAEFYSMWKLILSQRNKCRMDTFLYQYMILAMSDKELIYNYFSENIDVVVLVPAGLGPVVNPLDAVLVEFSPAVWLGTALAALFTAAALACTLRRDRGAALLLALAPLLAQAPGTPPPAGRALRPLLGVWLLVCVVLVAAYQGLLLGKLSTAQTRGEINSLEDLEASGLPVYAQWDAFHRVNDILPDDTRKRMNVIHKYNDKYIYRNVVRDRKSAIVLFLSPAIRRLVRTWLVPTKMLHYFPIDHLNVIVMSLWTRGSPLGPVVTKVNRRAEQAGLYIHHHAMQDAVERLARERRLRPLRPAQPLTLRQMFPAFVFLIGGHVLAAAAFIGEVLSTYPGRWCGLDAA